MIVLLIIAPLVGLITACSKVNYYKSYRVRKEDLEDLELEKNNNSVLNMIEINHAYIKSMALKASILTLSISVYIYILFNFSSNEFQFVREYYEISSYNIYFGVDGISIYFILLTTIIMPISLVSN